MGYVNFIQSQEAKLLKDTIIDKLVGPIPFKQVKELLPQQKGIYFIYDDSELLYIGKSGTGKTQKMRERCLQYIGTGTGATFRDKVMEYKSLDMNKAIDYIKGHCSIKYIIESELSKMEHLAIGLFNPKYND